VFGNTFLAFNSTSFVLYYAVSAKVSAKREVEIKLRISDIEDILRRIRKLGAESLGRVLEQNSLFDTPNSGFRRSRRLLRLRRQTPAPGHGMQGGPHLAILTSKAPPAIPRRTVPKSRIYKEVQENEEHAQDPVSFARTLRALGFRPGFRYEKYRTSFRHRSLHLDLDETPVGIFLELEGKPAEINRTARALGFASKDYIRATYWTLYAADCRRRHRKPRNMLFGSQKYR
jgi:adenylate cyclase, class 2